ncbi:hypothetical protein [Pseudonocardia thermophila]|uniref:hypothetical protein n=1 Tax=Pseudonocardia thermophila TaxID=1848 RepID=UPI001161340E|nr:hypothetical protein [Pseudonocardia thermophila]
MTRTMLVAVCAAAALLAGCANSNSNSQSSGSIGPALITPPAPLTPPAAQPTGTQPPATIQTATFGQRYTLPSGIAIEVLQPEPFQPSRTASGADGARAVLITVTVVNESAEPFDFNAFTLGPRAIHGGQAAERIFDSAKKVEIPPGVKLLPGKSITFRTAWALQAEPAEMQLEFTPSHGDEPAIFIGTV